MKIYTTSGRNIKEVIDSTIDILTAKYQVDKDFMENTEKIECLENILDLIVLKKHVY